MSGVSSNLTAPMKRCSGCQQLKPLVLFSKSRCRKDGHQQHCKSCQATYYQANRDRILPQIQAHKRAATKTLVDYVKTHKLSNPCIRCGEGDPAALDFHHHTNESKEFVVSHARRLRSSLKRVQAEMNKCVVLCANCHRKLHAGRFSL